MSGEVLPLAGGDVDEPHLEQVLEGLWGLLERGAADRRHGFHLPAVATVGADGRPGLRTVVLRAVERQARALRFHTDARSPKLAELRAEPRVALLFYDPAEQTQLRIAARAEVHRDDALAAAAWRATGPFSRRCYLQRAGPGRPLPGPDSALPPDLERRPPTPEESEAGRGNFAAVRCRASEIDWFYLCARGHRRARFAWDASGALEARWLAP